MEERQEIIMAKHENKRAASLKPASKVTAGVTSWTTWVGKSRGTPKATKRAQHT